ncbi:carboxylesterase family protein [Astrocystis sublimbata]|nr:carboxylesterase family protein [Astrocystis sublimbata]
MLRILSGILAFVGLSLAHKTCAPVVDLGYAKYRGVYNSTFGQNVFRGIRYAAPPVGKLRWQMPQHPARDRREVLSAVDFAPISTPVMPFFANPTRAPLTPEGDEDCLFLNVAAPRHAKRLPVLVWIHGGGYGIGSNFADDLQHQLLTNGNSYIAVSIAYRLGAFGFLSSADVGASGVVNAGIHDQRFALEWVKRNIHHFGGDPERVTIAGKSAGAGSVMLLAMANDGREGNSLFKGVIASSPYLPTQWQFDDAWPTVSYQAFVDHVGCSDAKVPFDCLQAADTAILQNASAEVSGRANYGQWAFIPVTDGKLIRKRPSEQLAINRRVNGVRVLTGNNENEAPGFTPRNITTKEDFISFVLTNYPRLSEQNLTEVMKLYTLPDDVTDARVDSNGQDAPFSTTNSNFATGWQQAANNLYAETTFVCPSYWLADAFGGSRGKRSWKYQYSVPISDHASDLATLFTDPDIQGTGIDKTFRTALQQTWGNFIVHGDPSLNTAQISTTDGGNITAASAGNWPQWGGRPEKDYMVNMNMTGGMPVYNDLAISGSPLNLTSYAPSTDGSYPPLEATFNLVSGWSWEGGRGERCKLWVELGQWANE